jgi:hypothetical protein
MKDRALQILEYLRPAVGRGAEKIRVGAVVYGPNRGSRQVVTLANRDGSSNVAVDSDAAYFEQTKELIARLNFATSERGAPSFLDDPFLISQQRLLTEAAGFRGYGGDGPLVFVVIARTAFVSSPNALQAQLGQIDGLAAAANGTVARHVIFANYPRPNVLSGSGVAEGVQQGLEDLEVSAH